MVLLNDVKQVRKFLVEKGVNPEHIYKIYNDRLVVGRRFKVLLVVKGGALTGEKALDQELALKIGNTLSDLGMEEITISQGIIQFKNRNT